MKLIQPNRQTEQLKSNLFFTGMLALIAVVLWIGISVYSAYSKSEPDQSIQSLLTPIDPTLDMTVIQQFQQSRVTPPQEFSITVAETKGAKANSYSLNPFTNSTRPLGPASPASPAAQLAPIGD